MDTIQQLQAKIKQLIDLKIRLEIETTTLHKEVDQVKNEAFGVVNKVIKLASMQLGRGVGLESILGETYSRAKNRQFNNAQEYIDHLVESISEIRDYVSHIDQCVANLEKCQHDLEYQIQETNSWITKADDLLKWPTVAEY